MHDIIEAKYIENYKLHIYFKNGVDGVFDFEDYKYRDGLFSNFKDLNYFKDFKINKDIGTICWHGDLDIAPDTLYYKISNEPLPEWIE
ncbi:MAG: DUF2442 domain-containing protein [Ignavibacteriae bacterium]|nr:DUF2442 domain-containing protein [Ignavibacteriota bacterium]